MMRIEAVIFDLDGTLIDSEPIHHASDEAFIMSKGFPADRSPGAEFVGLGGAASVDQLHERYGLEGDRGQLVAERNEFFLRFAVGKVRPFDHVLELVRYLWVHDYRLAVGTGASRDVLDNMLRQCGLSSWFETTVCADDVEAGKPYPATFLLAAQRLGVEPDNCLVIDDSEVGVEAAINARMPVLALPAPGHNSSDTYGRATMTVGGGPTKLPIDQVVDRFSLTPQPVTAADTVAKFQVAVREFASRHTRDMPWRSTNDPFHILASEFMLQQTQVSRVMDKYSEFVRRYRDPRELAAAPLSDLLRFWQGLGYNRRAKHLHDAARAIVERHDGQVPETLEELQKLPGVGPYTSAAVMAFAFRAPVTVVETNIRRLMLHYFFPLGESVHDTEVATAVERTVDRSDPRQWYYALMDYGSYLGRLFTNANKRSKHYATQSPFEGSVRQIRGRILRTLTRNGSMTKDELAAAVGPIDGRFEPALRALMRESMVRSVDGHIGLA